LLLGVGLYGPVRSLFSPPPEYVAGAPFTEQHILTEMLKEKLRSAGFTVDQRKGMSEGVQFLALRGNQIDCCVNYTGNIWAVLMKEKEPAERQRLYEKVTSFLRERYGVICLGKLGFENAYALVMRRDRAQELLGTHKKTWTVSRLAEQSRRRPISVACDLQFLRRMEWRQLRDLYDLRFKARHEGDPTLMYEKVCAGDVDVIVAYTSDGRIAKNDLELLIDDRRVLPSYDAILLVSAQAAAKPGFIEALEPLVRDGGAISDVIMQEANRQVDVDGKSPRRVGLELLKPSRLDTRNQAEGNRSFRRCSRRVQAHGCAVEEAADQCVLRSCCNDGQALAVGEDFDLPVHDADFNGVPLLRREVHVLNPPSFV
jgi:osmoprotectant transport system permease protein